MLTFLFLADKPGDQKKAAGEKRSAVVQLKRSSKSEEKSKEFYFEFTEFYHIYVCSFHFIDPFYNFILIAGMETKSLQSTIVGSTTNEKRASPPTDTSNNGNAKKPIHLRLGAMTKTFKPNKKTWRTEKVLSIIV